MRLTTHLIKFNPGNIDFGEVFYSKNVNPELFEKEEDKKKKRFKKDKSRKNTKKC